MNAGLFRGPCRDVYSISIGFAQCISIIQYYIDYSSLNQPRPV